MSIYAYAYQADLYCASCCLTEVLKDAGIEGHGLSHVTEEALDRLAVDDGIDREDEGSFDSDNFPKVCFTDQLEIDDRCCICGRWLKATEVFRIITALPGCLPEDTPYDVADVEAAREAVLNEIYTDEDDEPDRGAAVATAIGVEGGSFPVPHSPYIIEAVKLPLIDGRVEEALR